MMLGWLFHQRCIKLTKWNYCLPQISTLIHIKQQGNVFSDSWASFLADDRKIGKVAQFDSNCNLTCNLIQNGFFQITQHKVLCDRIPLHNSAALNALVLFRYWFWKAIKTSCSFTCTGDNNSVMLTVHDMDRDPRF